MIAPLLLVLPLAVLLTFVLARSRQIRLVATQNPGLANLDGTTIRGRWLGLVLGAALCAAVFATDRERGFYLAPTLLALGIATALTIAELAVWRAAQTPGIAGLEDRSGQRYLPRALLLWTALVAVGLVALLIWCADHQNTGWHGSAPGTAWYWESPDGLNSSAGSPFPGSHYSVPLVIALVVLSAITSIGAIAARRRPRNGSDPVIVAVDDDARRRSSTALAACLSGAVFGSALVCLFTASMGIGFFAGNHDDPMNHVANQWAQAVAIWGCLPLLALAAWAAAIILVPGSPRRVGP